MKENGKVRKRLKAGNAKPKIATAALVALLAVAGAFRAAADSTFVLWDSALALPAVCYRLADGWKADGAIAWNLRGDNKYLMSVSLYSPREHMYVQHIAPMLQFHTVMTPGLYAELQNADVLAQGLARELNQYVTTPGLGNFVARGGSFSPCTDSFPLALAAASDTGTGMTKTGAFCFEGAFTCEYGGVPCEARYAITFVYAISSAPSPRVPQVCALTRVSPILVVAPRGKIPLAIKKGGAMLAGAFANSIWLQKRDRTFAALVQGTIQGRDAGWQLWREAQQRTQQTMEKVRRETSEMIREVKTVDNPLEPGKKVERPAFFNKAWISSRDNTLLLSDTHLKPNTTRPLMEMGDWVEMQ